MARIYRPGKIHFVPSSLPGGRPTEVIRCPIKGYAVRETEAQVELRRFDRPARTRRAMVALAMFWGAAIASIFIPIAHFLLVPGFFIYGIVAARQRLNTEVVAVKAEGPCPDCGFAQLFDIAGRWDPPVESACQKCSRRLVIGDRWLDGLT